MIKLRARGVAALLGAALLLLGACSRGDTITWSAIYSQPPQADAFSAPVLSDQEDLRVAMPVSGGSWDPAVNTSQAMQGLMQLVFETPVRLDSALKPQEHLVSWAPGGDGVTWTFTVRRGVYFHDGSPLTAADIVKSLDHILQAGSDGPYGWILSRLTAWRAEDESTLIVTAANAGYAALYAMVFPVMKLQGEGYPLGTGPYKLTQYMAGERLDLIAQENWWRNAPRIKNIRATARDSAQSEMATFQLGELDIGRTEEITTTQYKLSGVSKTQEVMTSGYDALFFNFDRPMMADKRIRSAIAQAIDRQDLIANIYQNHAVARELPVPPDSWLNEAQLTGPAFDAAAAYTALEEIGFVDVDADDQFDLKPVAYRTTPEEGEGEAASTAPPAATQLPQDIADMDSDALEGLLLGQTVDPATRAALLEPLVILTNYDQENPVRRDAALRIREQLRAVGLPAEVTAVPLADMAAAVEAGEYDIALLGYQIPLSGDLRFMLSSRYEGEQSGFSLTRYTDVLLDDLLERPFVAGDDAAYRAAVVAVGEYVIREMPFIGLLFRTVTVASRENLNVSGLREERPFGAIEEWSWMAAAE